MEFRIEKLDAGLRIHIEDAAGREQALVEAIRRCRQSAWACPSGECVNIETIAERVEQGAVAGTSAFTPSEVLPPAPLPGGGLALAWRTGTSWQVGTWTPADAKAGSAPKALALARPATAAFTVDGVLWVASASADGSVVQAESMTGSPPRVVDAVALDGPIGDLVAISPNGRMLVAVSPGTRDVLLYRADPEAHFPLVADVAVAGTVTGVAFDESGETAYVITRVPEQLVALE